jgi:hypothetical protein
MDQTPWEAYSHFPRFYWKVNFHVDMTPPLGVTLALSSQLPQTLFFNTNLHWSIVLPFTPISPKWALSLRFYS